MPADPAQSSSLPVAPAGADPALAQALASLRPPVEPRPVASWPPAPGWYGLTLLAILLAACALLWYWHRQRQLRQTRYRRHALRLLEEALRQHPDPRLQLDHMARVLRRAAISAWGREAVAHLGWPALLARIPGQTVDERTLQLLDQGLYARTPPTPDDIQHVQSQLQAWLGALPPVSRSHAP